MSNETKVTYLPVSAIKVDPACQARAEMNTETINEYAEAMKERRDDAFPAIVVFHDGTDYWLSDGFHRYEAAKKAGLQSLKSRIRQGGFRQAVLNSVGTNANHGLRRTNADKRRAVCILLEDEEWSAWSNREIARRCGVDEGLVRKIKEEQASCSAVSADCPQIPRKVQRNGTPFEMKTGNIGKKDGLGELMFNDPECNEEARQGVAPDSDATAEAVDDEPKHLCDNVGVQLHELMSAWTRASEEVQQQFLTAIGVSQEGARLASPEPSKQSEPSTLQVSSPHVREPSQAREPLGNAQQQNPLFEMWKGFKQNSQLCGRQWVADGCPDELRPEHFKVTETLVPFRAAARAASREQWEQFLELTQVA